MEVNRRAWVLSDPRLPQKMYEQISLFEEKIRTNISPAYVEKWGAVEALREIVQENLDVKKKYACPGRVYYKNGFLIAEDKGPGLQRQDLALGNSGKRGEGSLIGQFGEGLKLAALVAAREKRKMFIESAGFTAVPMLEHEPALDCQVLTLEIRENKRKSGTKIGFEASEGEYRAAINLFLEYSKDAKKVTNNIFLPGGRIYVNGALAAQRNDLLFSYNLSGETAKEAQNRDRTVVNDEVLAKEIGKLLSTCRKTRIIEALFQTLKEKTECLEHRAYLEPPASDYPVWKRALKNVFGSRVCIEYDAVSDLEAEGKGFTVLKSIPYLWEMCLKNLGLKYSKNVILTKRRVKKIPLKYLPYEEKKNLLRAKRIVRKAFKATFGLNKLPPVKVVAAIKPNGAEEVQGTYSNGTIYIARKTLASFETALGTLAHETMHHVTGMPDCSREFERGWEKLVVSLLLKKKSKKETFRAPKKEKELMCARY